MDDFPQIDIAMFHWLEFTIIIPMIIDVNNANLCNVPLVYADVLFRKNKNHSFLVKNTIFPWKDKVQTIFP